MADPDFAIDNIYVYNHENTHEFALDGANLTRWMWGGPYYVFGKGFTADCTVKVGDNLQTVELVSDGCLKVTYDDFSGHDHLSDYDLVVSKSGTDKTLSSYVTSDNGMAV